MAQRADFGAQVDSGAEEGNGHRGIKDRIEHPFPELREKLKQTKLYDLKV